MSATENEQLNLFRIRRLRKQGDFEALCREIEAARDEPSWQHAAVSALAKLDDARVVEPLIHVLASGTDWGRAAAARGLGEHPEDPRVGPALIKALEDPVPEVWSPAALSLAKLNVREAVRPLIQLLRDQRVETEPKTSLPGVAMKQHAARQQQGYAVANVAKALGMLGDPRALPVLEETRAMSRSSEGPLLGRKQRRMFDKAIKKLARLAAD